MALLAILLLLFLNFAGIVRFFVPISYQESIVYYAEQNKLDPFLLAAVIKTESNFNSQAVSSKGACGLMQIMPDTGQWILKQMGEPSTGKDPLFDPNTNIKLGSWYLATLAGEFQNDYVLTLAAYNSGPGNVREWLAAGSFNGEVTEISQIPYPETRSFVQKVLKYQKIYSYTHRDLGSRTTKK
jgi:soluble lytic murein transglycosylase